MGVFQVVARSHSVFDVLRLLVGHSEQRSYEVFPRKRHRPALPQLTRRL